MLTDKYRDELTIGSLAKSYSELSNIQAASVNVDPAMAGRLSALGADLDGLVAEIEDPARLPVQEIMNTLRMNLIRALPDQEEARASITQSSFLERVLPRLTPADFLLMMDKGLMPGGLMFTLIQHLEFHPNWGDVFEEALRRTRVGERDGEMCWRTFWHSITEHPAPTMTALEILVPRHPDYFGTIALKFWLRDCFAEVIAMVIAGLDPSHFVPPDNPAHARSLLAGMFATAHGRMSLRAMFDPRTRPWTDDVEARIGQHIDRARRMLG